MKKAYFTSFLAICLVVFGLGQSLMAQELATPQSRWTVGFDVGAGMLLDCQICDPSNVLNTPLKQTDPESYQVISGNVNYRLIRWLELTANVGYGQLQAQSTTNLTASDGRNGYPLQQNVVEQYRMLTVGPKLMLRIHQGDLELAIRTGINLHNARVRATGFSGESIDVTYKLQLSRCSAVRLGYTYWPRPQFGIRAAAELFIGNRTTADLYEPRTPYATAFPALDTTALQQLTPNSGGVNSLNFSLGITYRFAGY
ncbi:MAG: hypothetical protein AAGJ82_08595 [Bacteroidota bacterium]